MEDLKLQNIFIQIAGTSVLAIFLYLYVNLIFMAATLKDILVIGVSSRALFDLEKEEAIFQKEGIDAYRAFQAENETTLLKPGTAYPLVKKLLQLNHLTDQVLVEVIVMSRNSPETGVRMLKTIEDLQLNISRIALSGGASLAPYMDGFQIDLFLSKDEKDVQAVIDSQSCAAGLIYQPPTDAGIETDEIRLAFDADAVIFSDESELRYKTEGIEAFHEFEAQHANTPLNKGPFADLIKKLSNIQVQLNQKLEKSPLRLAIVTARSAPSHMRVINTLREWGVIVDEAYFLGGLSKDKVLKAYGAHIFFDDQETHLDSSSKVVPSAKVPYMKDSELSLIQKKKTTAD